MAHHHHQHGTSENIRVAFLLNLGFTLAEIVGGVLINSVAILSDAVHDLGDSLALGTAWFLERYSNKASDTQFTYGYRRFSLLGALINSLVLIVGAVLVLSEAIPRLMAPESFSAPGMVIFALVGIAINGLAVLRLRGEESVNAQVVGWHLLEDVLGWAAVLVVGVVSLFADLPILDPLLSIGITAWVLFNVLRNLWRVLRLFLQAVPQGVDMQAVERDLLAIDGVCSLHHVHLWSLDGQHTVFTAHLVVEDDVTPESAARIKRRCRELVADLGLELEHVAVEIDYSEDDCSAVAGHAVAAQ